MLYLTKRQAAEMIAYGLKERPLEACGLLSGREGRVNKIYPMTNTDGSGATFLMDPGEQLLVMKEIRKREEELAAIFHSHVASPAYPSSHDVEMAFYPEVSYLIVSLRDKDSPELRSFKITDGKIKEEEINISD